MVDLAKGRSVVPRSPDDPCGRCWLLACALVSLLVGCERLPASRAQVAPAVPVLSRSADAAARAVPVEETSAEQTSAEGGPAEGASAKGALVEKTSAEGVPAEAAPSGQGASVPEPSPSELPASDRFEAIAPLTDEQRARLAAGSEELLPRQRVSFVKSNEIRHDLWFPYIEGLGGAYVGLGSDPNYTLIGVARSEFVFLVDRDPLVVNVHRVYGILIEASPDPQVLHQRFAREQHDASLAIIDAAIADRPREQQRQIRHAYRVTRETLWRYLRPLTDRQRQDCATSWMSNSAIYEHVRTLYRQGRVRPMVGDLRGTTTLRSIAEAVRGLDVPVNVLYLSNAEEYFTYDRAYRANLRALPVGEQAVVLRTIFDEAWEHADNFWNYQVHAFADFQRRLERDFQTRTAMWRRAGREGALLRTTETEGLSRIGISEPAPGAPPDSSVCGAAFGPHRGRQASRTGPGSIR